MMILRYTFLTLLITALFFVVYDLSVRTQLLSLAKTQQNIIPEKLVQKELNPPLKTINDEIKPKKEIFIEKFKKESMQIAKIQNNSDLVKNKIKDLANAMEPEDSDLLYNIVSNEKNKSEQRAIAMEVLSVKKDTSSLIALQNFVASGTSVNGTKWNRRNEFETVLRAQAVEGIASYPQKDIALSTLNYLKSKVDARFLADRIGRATAKIKKQEVSSDTKSVEETTLKDFVE